jgi:hypothetical protein
MEAARAEGVAGEEVAGASSPVHHCWRSCRPWSRRLKGGKARRSGAAGMEALEHAAEEAEDLLARGHGGGPAPGKCICGGP